MIGYDGSSGIDKAKHCCLAQGRRRRKKETLCWPPSLRLCNQINPGWFHHISVIRYTQRWMDWRRPEYEVDGTTTYTGMTHAQQQQQQEVDFSLFCFEDQLLRSEQGSTIIVVTYDVTIPL